MTNIFVRKLLQIFSSTFHKLELKVQIQRLFENVIVVSRLVSVGQPNSNFLGTLTIRLPPMSTSWQRDLPSQPKFLLPHARNADITSQSFNKALSGLDIDSMALTKIAVTQQRDQTLVFTSVSKADGKQNGKNPNITR